MRFLTDEALKPLDPKEFKAKTGITKADYRLLRDWSLAGMDVLNITVLSPKRDKKEMTLHELLAGLRNIDVLYVTRRQKERGRVKG